MKYFLALGSNLGNPERNLARAISLLKKAGMEIRSVSSLYRTEPVGFAGQPWFINQVLEAESGLSPEELFRAVKGIEKKMKRRPSVRSGPRIIDIDILLAEETVVRTTELSLPHPRLAERNFVLVPLAEIAPDVVHPILKKAVKDLLRGSCDRSRVEKIG